MNSQRQVSTFAIAMLMAGLVIVIGLSSASITIESEDLPGRNITIIVTDPLEELNSTIAEIGAELVSLSDKLNRVRDAMAVIGELDNRTDILRMDMEELRGELVSTNRELKMMRNSMKNITILFGLFSVIAIGIIAITRRP